MICSNERKFDECVETKWVGHETLGKYFVENY
jgi:hypothetical protein